MKLMKSSFLVFLTCTLAHGGMVDTFGLGSRNIALGNASTVTDGGQYSAQGNPASLVLSKGTSFSLGYINTNLNLDSEIGVRAELAESGIVDDPYSVSKAPSMGNLAFGATLPLSNYITLGIAGLMPSGSLAKIHTVSGNESTYLLFDDRQQVPEIYTSIGIQLPASFSIGVGAYYSAYAAGNVQMSTSEEDTDTRMVMDVVPTLSPFFGAMWTARGNGGRELVVGATYRGEQDARTTIGLDVNLETPFGSLPIESTSQLVAFYQPAEWRLGLAFKGGLLNSYISATRTLWSQYKSPEISLSGDILDLSDGAESMANIDLQDTMGYQMGFELPNILSGKRYSLNARMGLEYHTGALSEKPTSVNILDSERFVVGAGLGLRVSRIGTLITTPLTVDLAMKWISLRDKEIRLTDSDGTVTDLVNFGGNTLSIAAGVSFEI